MSDEATIQSVQPAEDSQVGVREGLHFLWRQWRLIFICAALSTIVGAIVLSREIPLYTASTVVLLEPRKEKAAGQETFLTDATYDSAFIESQLAIIKSDTVMKAVVQKENLTALPQFGAQRNDNQNSWADNIRVLLGLKKKPVDANATLTPATEAASMSALKASTNASRSSSSGSNFLSYLIDISVTTTDPARSAQIANAIALEYQDNHSSVRTGAAERASTWLVSRLNELKERVRSSEEAVATYRAQHNLPPASTSGATASLNQQQLADVNARLVAARADAEAKKSDLDLIRSASGKNFVQILPDAMKEGTLATLRGQYLAASQQEAELTARYGSRYPSLVTLHAQQKDTAKQIDLELQRMKDTVKNGYLIAKTRVAILEKAVNDAMKESGADDQGSIKLRELERSASVNKALFEDYLAREKVTEEQQTFDPRDIQVITPATEPGLPSYPVKSRTLIMYLVAGLAIGGGLALLSEIMNSGFTKADQIEAALHLAVLASIGVVADDKKAPVYMGPKLKPLSRFSEAIRRLRSGVHASDVDNPPRAILFASSLPEEGKTTVALTTATSLANSGFRVLVIDADLRHPHLSDIVGLSKNVGLVDVLTGDVDVVGAIKSWTTAGFDVLASGAETANPADLLSSQKMKTLLIDMKATYDYVIVDSAPIGVVSDAQALTEVVDKVVMVLRWSTTPREVVAGCIKRINAPGKIAGIVCNLVDEAKAKKYGHQMDVYAGLNSRALSRYYVE